MEKKVLIAAMVLVAALASLGVFVGYSLWNRPANFNVLNSPTDVGNSTQYPISIGVVTSHPSSVMAIISSNGASNTSALKLTLSLSNPSISQGQSINVVIDESNTLNTTNVVNASHDWPVFLAIGPCGTLNDPMGVAFYQGYYTASNISGATSLEIYQPGLYNCPCVFWISFYAFQPLSDEATVIPTGSAIDQNGTIFLNSSNDLCWTSSMSAGVTANGYWTDSNPTDAIGQDAVFHNFEPGVYTVAGGDEWGQLVILHFYVT